MAAPTASQLAQIRFWVPAEWTPADKFSTGAVFQAFAQHGTVNGTALALCRLKLALLVNEPSSFSVGAEYSQSTSSAVSALQRTVTTLEGFVVLDKRAPAIVAYALTRVGGHGR